MGTPTDSIHRLYVKFLGATGVASCLPTLDVASMTAALPPLVSSCISATLILKHKSLPHNKQSEKGTDDNQWNRHCGSHLQVAFFEQGYEEEGRYRLVVDAA